jgi:exodeoxyribonuclease III
MKITTWNVNGFRSVLNKGFVDWVTAFKPDILCLQETKVKEEQLPDMKMILPDYQTTWFSAEKAGYSGVATFLRGKSFPLGSGTGVPIYDSEGRIIRTEIGNTYLYNIYFPNGQRDQDRLSYKLDFYDHLLQICDTLHQNGKSIIITGDFNTAHKEIDLANPKENSKTSGFLPEERAWVDKYLAHGFTDAFRFLYPDRVAYTWWTYRFTARERNIGWRLDYFLVSNSLMEKVKDVLIHDDVKGSDHCPVTLEIDI